MKTGFISDLHLDINADYPVLEMLAELSHKNELELLVIAGDITEKQPETIKAIKRLKELAGIPVYYVPGNHDMWHKNMPEVPNDEIYQKYIEDENCLSGKHVILDGKNGPVGLVGDVGWYEYTFADPSYSFAELEAMSNGERTWQDHLYNEWTKDNSGRMKTQVDALEEQIKACGNIPIVAVTHMLPVDDFCVPDNPDFWGYFNAFLGGKSLEEMYVKYNVKVAVCGHVHYRKECVRDGIHHICPCVGYFNEWPLYTETNGDAYKNIEDSLKIVDL